MTSNDLKLISKDDDKAVFKKVKSEKISKAGDPDDSNQSNGKDLIGQTFLSN